MKTWTPDEIKAKLLASDVMVERSLMQIYKLQTSGERAAGATVEYNGVGFNGVDAPILSSFAEWIQRSTYPEGRRLTQKQLALARKKMVKYTKQLLAIANAAAGSIATAVTEVASTAQQLTLETGRPEVLVEIELYEVPEHFNSRCQATIPLYWQADIVNAAELPIIEKYKNLSFTGSCEEEALENAMAYVTDIYDGEFEVKFKVNGK